jgi:hypothetical protein
LFTVSVRKGEKRQKTLSSLKTSLCMFISNLFILYITKHKQYGFYAKVVTFGHGFRLPRGRIFSQFESSFLAGNELAPNSLQARSKLVASLIKNTASGYREVCRCQNKLLHKLTKLLMLYFIHILKYML